jgi:Domain of unknown function (DUF4167)
MMRPGQHNNRNNNNNNRNNRNRNRNNRGSGGGGGQQGGSNSNRVLDSNGPDVKLRGTPQTIAEKYMQLGRDAQLSGDRVMSESYYQHADHYYRLWLAAQPVGQPLQFSRRLNEDDVDEDGNPIVTEGDDGENGGNEGSAPYSQEGGEVAAEGSIEGQAATGDDQGQNRPNRQQRDNRDGQPRDNRDGQQRDKFRPRWPRRNFENRDGAPVDQTTEQQVQSETQSRPDRQERPEPVEAPVAAGEWEAPSFLTRSIPIPVEPSVEAVLDAPVERRPRGRRPKVIDEVPTPDVAPPSDD